ncbi:MAG: hypothetical protein M9962_07525 [Oligoflexia bacterium]|nr:hypothetical protein [Oligoflexia bacterium]
MIYLLALIILKSSWAYSPNEFLLKISQRESSNQLIKEVSGVNKFNPFNNVSAGLEKSDLEKDKYKAELKLEIKGIFEHFKYHSASNALNQNIETSNSYFQAKKRADELKLLILTAFAKEQLLLINESRRVLEKNQKINAIEANRTSYDIKNLFKANKEIESMREDAITSQTEISSLSEYIREHGFKIEDLETNKLIEPNSIFNLLNKISINSGSLTKDYLESTAQREQKIYELEKAKNNKIIDEVTFSLESDKGKKNVYGLGVSINLPFLNATDLKQKTDELKQIENAEKYRTAAIEESGKIPRIVEIAKQKIELYRHIETSLVIEQNAEKTKNADPFLIMEIKRSILKSKFNKAKLLAEIRTAYIDALFEQNSLPFEKNPLMISEQQ